MEKAHAASSTDRAPSMDTPGWMPLVSPGSVVRMGTFSNPALSRALRRMGV